MDWSGSPLAVPGFLRLAIGIVTAVGHLHGRGLIHQDIKPANLLVNVVTGKAWLTGFGLTSRLPRHRPSLEPHAHHGGDAGLHGSGANRKDEPLYRFQKRSLFLGRDVLRDARRCAAIHRQ